MEVPVIAHSRLYNIRLVESLSFSPYSSSHNFGNLFGSSVCSCLEGAEIVHAARVY